MKKFPRFLLVSFIIAVVIAIISQGEAGVEGCAVLGLMFGAFSFCFDTKEQKQARAAAVKREEDRKKAEEQAKKAPGCYSKDGVDILTFNSQNNILTAGNNFLRFKIRNRNAYGVIVSVKYKYSDGWEDSTHSFEVAGNAIRTVETSGDAWRKATDITIAYVH